MDGRKIMKNLKEHIFFGFERQIKITFRVVSNASYPIANHTNSVLSTTKTQSGLYHRNSQSKCHERICL